MATTSQSSPPLDYNLPDDHNTIHAIITPSTSSVDERNITTSPQASPQSLSVPPTTTFDPPLQYLADQQEIFASSISVAIRQLLNPSTSSKLTSLVAPHISLM